MNQTLLEPYILLMLKTSVMYARIDPRLQVFHMKTSHSNFNEHLMAII